MHVSLDPAAPKFFFFFFVSIPTFSAELTSDSELAPYTMLAGVKR